jgi:SAM-dependent methyltransferase
MEAKMSTHEATQTTTGAADSQDSQQWRTFSYEVSEAIAPTWASRREEIEHVCNPVRDWLIRELRPQPGDTVLELAAGVGDTGFEAARIIGESGQLISSDFSPAMVDAARRRGAQLGLENVDYRVLDAERIELEADSVDGALCRYGYMLMTDRAAALAETRRVLRPGGRVALTVWGPPERNPFFTIIGGTLAEGGHIPPPDPEGPGIFSMATAERTTALLDAAGFASSRVEEIPVRFESASLDEYLTFLGDTAGPIALALRSLSPEDLNRVKAQVEEIAAPFEVDGGYEFPGLTLAAVAS